MLTHEQLLLQTMRHKAHPYHPGKSHRFLSLILVLLTTTCLQNKNVVSVKGGCLEGLDWSRAIHIWTKSAMIPIPEGAESYSGESTQSSGYGDSQETLDQPDMLTGSGGLPGGRGLPRSADQARSGGDEQAHKQQQQQGLCELSGMPTEAGNVEGHAGVRLSSELEGWHQP